MRGKKVLGLILTMSLMAGTSINAYAERNINVQAYKQVVSAKYNGNISYVQPNKLSIIDMLKREGKIPKNATEEQIEKIYLDYLETCSLEEYQPTKEEAVLNQQIRQKIQQDAINKKSLEKGTMNAKTMEVENWTGEVTTKKPLVIMVDFPDYKYTDITKEEKDKVIYDNFTPQHYSDLFFGNGVELKNGKRCISMREYYKQQSGGSLDVNGYVQPKWYTASKPAREYGCDVKAYGLMVGGAYDLLVETLASVGDDVDLSQYDTDKDGVVDNLILVHAGVGAEDGGGLLTKDSIWSHRMNLGEAEQITTHGGKTFKIKNYVVAAQNTTTGVMSHEFGHDLGLPDEYNTDGFGAEPVSNWSIMANGSWLGEVGGTEPSGLSPYDKQYLQVKYGGNWQDQARINIEDLSKGSLSYVLDQASVKGKNHDCIRVDLPKKVTTIAKPVSGEKIYFSGKPISGQRIKNSMTTKVDLSGKTKATLKFKANYDIQEGYDFATIQVRKVGTEEWTEIAGNITTTKLGKGATVKVKNGITGKTWGAWKDAQFDLTEFAGQNIEVKFQYETDDAKYGDGFYVDDISIEADDQVIFSNNAETLGKFTLDGFKIDNGQISSEQYYLLEWRNHQGVDASLAKIYNVLEQGTGTLTYDPGLLVWYVDELYERNEKFDNGVGNHPGEGFLGVVDADQSLYLMFPTDGSDIEPWPYTDSSNVAQVHIHDATFSLRKGSESVMKRSKVGLEGRDINTLMNPIFDDSKSYMFDKKTYRYTQKYGIGFMQELSLKRIGRKVPKLGLKIRVESENADRSSATIRIFK